MAYAAATEKVWLVVGDGYRGVYNSAWIGALMAICCSTWLSLIGFYVVKNSIQRDSDTRVGRILAATPMRKDAYTIAKTLSNFSVLGCMILILMLAALAMQWTHGESGGISLWQLWSPFLFLAMPSMALTASLAVLFETLPVLRTGVGNVLYFFLWTALLAMGGTGTWDDAAGLRLLSRSTRAALEAIDATNIDGFAFTLGGRHAGRIFLWNGIDWTGPVLLHRLIWVAVAMGLTLLASIFFTRFDPAKEWLKRRSQKVQAPAAANPTEELALSSSRVIAIAPGHLTPLLRTTVRWRFPQLVASELRLMLKGKAWWWYTVATGLLIAEVSSPQVAARQGVLLAAWIWPITIWSQMGCREKRAATEPLLFSSPGALTRQLPALWTAGVVVAILTGGGIGIRLLLSGDWHSLAAWVSAALFIPSLALVLGIWSGSGIPFEALYTAWWYMGPAHQVPGLDFMGTTPASSSAQAYASAAVILLACSYWRRRMRLGYA